jgi:hypothetical protein
MERSTRPLQPSADGPAAAEQAGPELSPSDEAWAARVVAMAHRHGMAPRGVREMMAGFPPECIAAAVSALAALRAP